LNNKQTILITGAAGMIAWHTIQALSKLNPNLHFIGIDNYLESKSNQFTKERIASLSLLTNFQFVSLDLCNNIELLSFFNMYNITHIIHLAANSGVSESFNNPKNILINNHNSFINILECIRLLNSKIPIIYASSSSIYGSSSQINTSESHIPLPISSYGLSKLHNEGIADIYSKQYGLKLIGLRFFTAYGEYIRKDMFIFKALESITHGIPLTLYHKGKMQRDFTYCGDIAEILFKLISKIDSFETHQHLIFNVGNGKPIATLFIIQHLEKLLNKSANLNIVDDHPNYDPILTHADNTKLTNFLNLISFTPIEIGLEKTIIWYNKYLFNSKGL
jgi:UDP-glucuronate 4-epimerase